MSALIWPPKDPDEVLDYGVVWSQRGLGSDTIASTTCTKVDSAAAITVQSHTIGRIRPYPDAQATITVLSGGVDGQIYEFIVRITTQNGRVLEERVRLAVVSK